MSHSGELLIGLDAGTTSVKAVLMRPDGKVLASAGKEYALDTSMPNQCEVNPAVYWESAIHCIRQLLRESAVHPSAIRALAISSQGETFICTDATGRPLRNAIVWLDNRSVRETEILRKEFGQKAILEATGQPEILPTWPATKLLWLRKHEPETYVRTDKFLLVEDYLMHCLSGRFCTEYSVISSSLYFHITQKALWLEMLDFLGLSSTRFPEILPSAVPVGTLTADAARLTGLDPATLVVTGAYDHAAGAVGAGNIDEGMITETTGASMAMVVTSDKPVFDRWLHLPCQCHAVADKYFLLPYGQTAGIVLKWFRDQFASQIRDLSREYGLDPYDLLTAMASQVAPGAGGVVMLPHLMGTGSPEFNPSARAVWAGMSLETNKAHMIRSILEGVAAMIRRNIETLKEYGISVSEIRALGGGARSPLWNQIKADMTGVPILTVENDDTPAVGAAVLAGAGSGLFPDLKKATRQMVRIRESYSPNPAFIGTYNEVYRKYCLLSDLLIKYWKD